MTKKELDGLTAKMYKYLQTYIKDEDLVQDIAEVFLRRNYIEKFNPELSNFKTFITRYSKFIIGNINVSKKYLNTVSLIEGCHDEDKSLSIDNDMIKKRLLSEIKDYFTPEEIDIMEGGVSRADIGRRRGITRQAVSDKLLKKIDSFKKTQ